MNEIGTQQYFSQTEEEPEPPKQLDSFLEGICGKCLNTGFTHIVDKKTGALGVAYTSFNQDASGNPIKKLMVCNHNRNMNI